MFGSTKFWMLCCHHHHPHKLPEGQSKLWLFPQTQKENYYLQWQLWVQHCRGELLQGAEEKSLLTGLPGLHSKSQRCLLWPLSLVEMMEITESLNDWGWQGSLEVSLCNPAQAGPPGAGYTSEEWILLMAGKIIVISASTAHIGTQRNLHQE